VLSGGATRGAARLFDGIRSDRDRVAATVAGIRRQLAQRREAPSGRVRIDGPQGLVVERSDVLTPYVLETVYDDAWRAGPGATVTIAVDAGSTDEQIARLRSRLAPLERRGAAVHVARRPDGAHRDA
jgi:hypothetical protein